MSDSDAKMMARLDEGMALIAFIRDRYEYHRNVKDGPEHAICCAEHLAGVAAKIASQAEEMRGVPRAFPHERDE